MLERGLEYCTKLVDDPRLFPSARNVTAKMIEAAQADCNDRRRYLEGLTKLVFCVVRVFVVGRSFDDIRDEFDRFEDAGRESYRRDVVVRKESMQGTSVAE